MSTKIVPVFLDTSYIRKVGFCHPDFQKLVQYSRSNLLRLFVSHIVWEERRTQFLEAATSQVFKLRRDFDTLHRQQPDNFILEGLPSPMMSLWDPTELEARSHEAMAAFAKDNHITVVPLGADHADRAWRRYFQTSLPFNPDVTDREERRKDIPDSWILEAAIDVKREHSSLVALCDDKRFAAALAQVLAIPVFKTAQEALDHIDGTAQGPDVIKSVKTRDAAYVPPKEGQLELHGALAAAFTEAESQFRTVGTKVVGLVSHLGSPTKDQVYAILERSGVPTAVSRNVAEQLALGKIILDTGHHYVPGNKEAGDLAKAAVEPEIIRLITGGD
ncbi:MAG: DUF4935 domain-containing protein [Nitrospinae bacterium]|nr:DUF4935 domain-containing protein [Nitrospinota bacterium]